MKKRNLILIALAITTVLVFSQMGALADTTMFSICVITPAVCNECGLPDYGVSCHAGSSCENWANCCMWAEDTCLNYGKTVNDKSSCSPYPCCSTM